MEKPDAGGGKYGGWNSVIAEVDEESNDDDEGEERCAPDQPRVITDQYSAPGTTDQLQ